MSVAEPRLRRAAATAWSRFQRSFRSSDTSPDCLEPGLSPAELWIGAESPRRIVYLTKLALHRRIVELFRPMAPLVIYGYGGLPSTAFCRHLRATWRFLRIPVFFLGDLDPGDLTVLLALARGNPHLRSGRPGVPVIYSGIGDVFLDCFRRRLSAAQFRAAVLDMTPDELRHFHLLRQMFVDLEGIIGSESMRFLDRGKKIEVEGLLRWAREGSQLRRDLKAFLLGPMAGSGQ